MPSARSEGTEFLDQPDCHEKVAESSYRFMAMVNRWFGGARVVRNFIRGELRRRRLDRPLRVLDIGSGSCDIPLSVCRWAKRHGAEVAFTCLDPQPQAVRAATRRLAAHPRYDIEVVPADVFTYEPDAPHDCALASMVLHHLSEDEILRLLARLGHLVPRLFVNDLLRNWSTLLTCRLLGVGWPREVRHDAMLSIRRGFRARELREILARASVTSATVRVAALHRVTAVVDLHRSPCR